MRPDELANNLMEPLPLYLSVPVRSLRENTDVVFRAFHLDFFKIKFESETFCSRFSWKLFSSMATGGDLGIK